MGRPKLYKDDAHKQAAYRQRKTGLPAPAKTDSAIRKQLLKLSHQFLELRKEITRRRKEAGARRAASNWNVDAANKVELRELLDYIELELDRLGTDLMED